MATKTLCVMKYWPIVGLLFLLLFESLHGRHRLRHNHRKFRCSKCPPGYGVQVHCTPSNDTVCEKCPPGWYSPHHSYQNPCWLCSRCGEGLYEAHSCTPSSDTICDSCHTYEGPHNEDYLRKCSNFVPAMLGPAKITSVPSSLLLNLLEVPDAAATGPASPASRSLILSSSHRVESTKSFEEQAKSLLPSGAVVPDTNANSSAKYQVQDAAELQRLAGNVGDIERDSVASSHAAEAPERKTNSSGRISNRSVVMAVPHSSKNPLKDVAKSSGYYSPKYLGDDGSRGTAGVTWEVISIVGLQMFLLVITIGGIWFFARRMKTCLVEEKEKTPQEETLLEEARDTWCSSEEQDSAGERTALNTLREV